MNTETPIETQQMTYQEHLAWKREQLKKQVKQKFEKQYPDLACDRLTEEDIQKIRSAILKDSSLSIQEQEFLYLKIHNLNFILDEK